MSKLLKDIYDQEFLRVLFLKIESVFSDFDSQKFVTNTMDNSWDEKSFKERMMLIANTLGKFLPSDYNKALFILKSVSVQCTGFEYMFFPAFVQLYGLDNYSDSIKALEFFTEYSSSEFAVRPFIIRYKEKMMKQMLLWTESDNFHVRRLASEGCRPILPWSPDLPAFRSDPTFILPILEKLKNDSSEYVRRSVANNLNSISKDNPEVTIALSKKWFGNNHATDKIVKHGCRTLLKRGNAEVLHLFNFVKANHIKIEKFIVQESVSFEEVLHFSFSLITRKKELGNLRIEYIISFKKKNGSLAGKIFKISEGFFKEAKKHVEKKYSFKKISTRKYYPGTHKISIVINGFEVAEQEFQLLAEKQYCNALNQ